MIERPAAALFRLADSPPQDCVIELGEAGLCRVCATETTRGAPYERWQGSNFTDQNKLRYVAGTVVCEACVWAHAWNPPPGAPRPEKGKKGLNLRLFSHLYDGRGYHFVNKADKPQIRAWLLAPKAPPWWCAIADSGQKHVLPWTPVNLSAMHGVVRFEEQNVPLGDGQLVRDLCDLLTAGATKAEVEAGEYRPQMWLRAEGAVRAFERTWGHERGGGWFALGVWLAQRDEEAVAARRAAEKEAKADGRGKTRSRAGRGDRPTVGGAERVPAQRGERAQALATDPGSRIAGDEDERADQRVGNDAGARAPAGEPEQLSLLGIDRSVR